MVSRFNTKGFALALFICAKDIMIPAAQAQETVVPSQLGVNLDKLNPEKIAACLKKYDQIFAKVQKLVLEIPPQERMGHKAQAQIDQWLPRGMLADADGVSCKRYVALVAPEQWEVHGCMVRSETKVGDVPVGLMVKYDASARWLFRTVDDPYDLNLIGASFEGKRLTSFDGEIETMYGSMRGLPADKKMGSPSDEAVERLRQLVGNFPTTCVGLS